DGLMHAASPGAVGFLASGVLIDDHHLSVVDDVIAVALVEDAGVDREFDQFLAPLEAPPHRRQRAGFFAKAANSLLGKLNAATAVIDLVMRPFAEAGGDLVGDAAAGVEALV